MPSIWLYLVVNYPSFKKIIAIASKSLRVTISSNLFGPILFDLSISGTYCKLKWTIFVAERAIMMKNYVLETKLIFKNVIFVESRFHLLISGRSLFFLYSQWRGSLAKYWPKPYLYRFLLQLIHTKGASEAHQDFLSEITIWNWKNRKIKARLKTYCDKICKVTGAKSCGTSLLNDILIFIAVGLWGSLGTDSVKRGSFGRILARCAFNWGQRNRSRTFGANFWKIVASNAMNVDFGSFWLSKIKT